MDVYILIHPLNGDKDKQICLIHDGIVIFFFF